MKSRLLTIFTDYNYDCGNQDHVGANVFENLNVEYFGSDNCPYIVITFESGAQCLTSWQQMNAEAEVLIVRDECPDDMMNNLLHGFINLADEVFVVFHKNPHERDQTDAQENSVREICESLNKPWEKIYQSHVSEDVYCKELVEISTAISSKDRSTYTKAIKSILDRFGDKVLEAKLELLHKCLDENHIIDATEKNSILGLLQEGNEKTEIRVALDAYSSGKAVQMEEPQGTPEFTDEDIEDATNAEVEKIEDDGNHIKKLTVLRNVLLGE